MTYIQVEVETEYNRKQVIKKINSLPPGWFLLFYVKSGMVQTFRKGLSNINGNELESGNVSVIVDRVQVQSIDKIETGLEEFYKSVDNISGFTTPSGGSSSGQGGGGNAVKQESHVSEEKESTDEENNGKAEDDGTGADESSEEVDATSDGNDDQSKKDATIPEGVKNHQQHESTTTSEPQEGKSLSGRVHVDDAILNRCKGLRGCDGKDPDVRWDAYMELLTGISSFYSLGSTKFFMMSPVEKKRAICAFMFALSRPGKLSDDIIETKYLWRLIKKRALRFMAEFFGFPTGDGSKDANNALLKALLDDIMGKEFGRAQTLSGQYNRHVCGNKFYYGGELMNGTPDLELVDGVMDATEGVYRVNPSAIDVSSLCGSCCDVGNLASMEGLYIEDGVEYTGVPQGWLDSVVKSGPSSVQTGAAVVEDKNVNNAANSGQNDASSSNMNVNNSEKKVEGNTTAVNVKGQQSWNNLTGAVSPCEKYMKQLIDGLPQSIKRIAVLDEMLPAKDRAKDLITSAITLNILINRKTRVGFNEYLQKGKFEVIDTDVLLRLMRQFMGHRREVNEKAMAEVFVEFRNKGVIADASDEVLKLKEYLGINGPNFDKYIIIDMHTIDKSIGSFLCKVPRIIEMVEELSPFITRLIEYAGIET